MPLCNITNLPHVPHSAPFCKPMKSDTQVQSNNKDLTTSVLISKITVNTTQHPAFLSGASFPVDIVKAATHKPSSPNTFDDDLIFPFDNSTIVDPAPLLMEDYFNSLFVTNDSNDADTCSELSNSYSSTGSFLDDYFGDMHPDDYIFSSDDEHDYITEVIE